MTPKEKIALRQIEKGRYAIDVRGYTCPYPEIFVRRALDSIGPGDVLETVLDNAPSCETIPAAAEELKHKVLEVTKLDQTNWKIVVKKS